MPSKPTHDFTGNDVDASSQRSSMFIFNPGGYMSPQHYPETHSETSSAVALEALSNPPRRRASKRRGILKKLSRPFQRRPHDAVQPPSTLGEGEARALVYDTGALSRYPDVGPALTGVVLPAQSKSRKGEAGRPRQPSPLPYDSPPPRY